MWIFYQTNEVNCDENYWTVLYTKEINFNVTYIVTSPPYILLLLGPPPLKADAHCTFRKGAVQFMS
jgi:hypothetical protein